MAKAWGLLAEYLLEGNADDSSGSGLNGVVSGAVLAAGRFGQGYRFDGAVACTMAAARFDGKVSILPPRSPNPVSILPPRPTMASRVALPSVWTAPTIR